MVWNHTGAFDRMMWRKYRYPAINIRSEVRYPCQSLGIISLK